MIAALNDCSASVQIETNRRKTKFKHFEMTDGEEYGQFALNSRMRLY